jgi:hypothetical protein
MSALRRAGLVLGTGYVLFFFSETVFWSVWRPGDTAHGRLLGWLVYSLLGYLTLAVIHHGRVRGGRPLLLVGALFGWLGEGVFATTLFGDASMPFPFTIAWTALAWHAPLSLCVGWYAIGRALRDASPNAYVKSLALFVALGVWWGVWGSGWRADSAPVRVAPAAFLLHATVATAGLALAHVAIAASMCERFRPSRVGLAVASALVLGIFAVVTVPKVKIAAIVLPVLLAIVTLAIRRDRRDGDESALASLAAPIAARNLLALAAMPLTASAVYAIIIGAFAPSGAVHPLLAVVSTCAGVALFVLALWRAARGR